MSTAELIEALLYEEEGSSLDFKREQYRFQKATDEEKSELLKDVLAFANAWRRSDAYIVIGVTEVKGGKCQINGINGDLDDAQLQQFVQSKVNKPVRFSYLTSELEGKKVAVITIPVQSRPLFLKKDFGKLKANTVYVRRGSSTTIALPDEIASMGSSDSAEIIKSPRLSPFVVSGEHDEIRSARIDKVVLLARIPDSSEFPLYGQGTGSALIAFNANNPNYYAEYAEYIRKIKSMFSFKIGIENVGNLVAMDVRATLDLIGLPEGTKVFHERSLPERPQRTRDIGLAGLKYLHQQVPYYMVVNKIRDGFRVEIDFGKVQAKDTVICQENICLSVTQAFQLPIPVTIFSDDLEAPDREEFMLEVTTIEKELSVDDFVNKEK